MNLWLDSAWRALLYCLMPRVIVLTLLPLLVITLASWAAWYFYWTPVTSAAQALLEHAWGMQWLLGHLQTWGVSGVPAVLAPLFVLILAIPAIIIACLLLVTLWLTPSFVNLVAQRRFPDLEHKQGGTLASSLMWALGSTAAAVIGFVVSLPLWLIPPLILILPPLIWGWLTFRIMAFDALAEHASREERRDVLRRHRLPLLLMGVCTGFLSAAPGIVWISGLLFAALFFVLIPLALWIYMLIFAFTSLWFAHYCLAALAQLRALQQRDLPPSVSVSVLSDEVQ